MFGFSYGVNCIKSHSQRIHPHTKPYSIDKGLISLYNYANFTLINNTHWFYIVRVGDIRRRRRGQKNNYYTLSRFPFLLLPKGSPKKRSLRPKPKHRTYVPNQAPYLTLPDQKYAPKHTRSQTPSHLFEFVLCFHPLEIKSKEKQSLTLAALR